MARSHFTSEEDLEYARALSLSSLHSGGWQADLHTDLLMSASPGDVDMTQLIGTLIDKQKAAETSIQVLHSAGAALPKYYEGTLRPWDFSLGPKVSIH